MPGIVGELRREVENRWLQGSLPFRPLLRVASSGYGRLLAARSWLYRHGWVAARRLPAKVIGVGNLTLGGTGKTVVVAHLAGWLRDRGLRVGIVSRGYGRRASGVRVVSDGSGPLLDVDEAGDEPYLLARALPGVAVVVGADRYQAGRLAIERFRSHYLLLDDAFQNLAVVKDVEILLINARDPWGSGELFPAGVLREPLPALARADWIILTRADGAEPSGLSAAIRGYNDRAPILRASYAPGEVSVRGEPGALPPEHLRGKRCLGFAGIADPASFEGLARASGAVLLDFRPFRDHHPYTQRDLASLEAQARALGADALLTTEKDAVRLPAEAPLNVPLWVLRIRLQILQEEPGWADLFRCLT